MPFVRIDLHQGKSQEELSILSRSIHKAMVETIDVPKDNYFQVITTHASGELLYDKQYMNISRSEQQIFIQITMKEGRTMRKKQAFICPNRGAARRESRCPAPGCHDHFDGKHAGKLVVW